MSGRGRWPAVAVFAIGIGVLGWIGHSLLWSTYMAYDDEGYVLYSLRAYAEHGHLYSDVYSQYGPFFYVLCSAMRTVGLAFTNVGAREATLVCWLGAAVFCAVLTWRASRGNTLAAVAAMVGVFVHLHVMSAEPSHPGGFIALVVAAGAWLAAHSRIPLAAKAAALGAFSAMIMLTKINVGGLLFIGFAAWWWLWLLSPRGVGWRVAIALGWVAIVTALMLPSWSEPWIRIFAGVVCIGGAALVAVIPPAEKPRVRLIAAWPAVAGGALIAALTVLTMFAKATSWHDIVEGTVVGPIHHPAIYHLSLNWRTGTIPLALLSFVAARAYSKCPAAWRLPVLAVTRVAGAIAYIVALTTIAPISLSAWVACFGISTAWIYVAPLRDDDEMLGTRALLALLLVTQSLHAYPVAGSQLNWGTFLWIPLAVLGLVDLGPLVPTRSVRRLLATLSSALVLGIVVHVGYIAWERDRGSDTLRLPGADDLRLPEEYTTAIRTMARNSEVHGDVLFTLPGMMSFNAWTGIQPPTLSNTTHWFNLLSTEQQLEIKSRLESSPRSVVIVQRYVYDLLQSQQFIHGSPLLDWILDRYVKAFAVGSYEFWVKKGREIEPVDIATLYASPTAAAAKYRVSIRALLDRPAVVAKIELRRFGANDSIRLGAWTNDNAVFQVAAANPAGASAQARRLPFPAAGQTTVDVYTAQFPVDLERRHAVIYLLDAEDHRIGEARFVE